MQLVRVLAVVAVVVLPGAARADSVASALRLEGWYGKLGVESGVVFAREREAAPRLGGVATLVHVNNYGEWFGLQSDLLVDWNGGRDAGMRWSAGPEAGVMFYGADIGYFGERVDGANRHGMQVRAKLTVGLAAVYVRGAFTVTPVESKSIDVGVQLKLPVFMKRHRRVYAGAVAQKIE